MNRPLTKGLALLLSGLLLTGCAASPETKPAMATQPVSQPDTKEYLLQDHMVPVIIKDAEIRVGETRLETLLEHDFDLTIPVIRNDEIGRAQLWRCLFLDRGRHLRTPHPGGRGRGHSHAGGPDHPAGAAFIPR